MNLFRKSLFLLLSLLIVINHHSCFGADKQILFDTHINGLIAAFNDFDSDRFTDIFIITDNGHSMKLLKSQEDEPDLQQWDQIKCSFENEKITGIIPADFSGDAIMDVLVITQPESMEQLFKIWILRGNKTHLECKSTKKPLLDNALGHPLILDYNGDMITDFLIETRDCPYELWLMNSKHFRGDCRRNQFGDTSLRLPHSNAFVNIRNCLPDSLDYTTDIVITNKNHIEYWLNREGFNVENRINIRYPDESLYTIGQSAYIDLNIDGCIEHIIAACKKVGFFHTQCLPQILWYDNKQNEWINIADFTNHSKLYFETIDTQFGIQLPIAIRFGDVDSDGYVDLITVMKNKTESGRIKQIAVILRNIRDDDHPNRRKFVLFWTSEKLIPDDDVELVSFLDLQENGKLDIILTTKNSSNHYNIQWILNTFVDNSCFLKILVTSGLCSESSCPNEKVPYGTNQAGPFVCYETSDVNGHLMKGCSAQLSQSSYFALQMPYSIFGLGETPNFVETVIASIPSGDNQPTRKSKWTQIVPDAQVVLIPYPPNETMYWIGKLFYTPSNMISSTLAALAILCAVLIVIIFILHRKEVLEDLTEHEEYKRHWPESR
ncbi:T-cell immunomodulatory protein [Dermatophagoides farinae]|uniref:T-cell immunomodulatory protein-like protein n=2 Tax=Dermatophagoides farinae TaxID=6954 RepID=A0A9D4NR10_DERFA|nr:T-cell immunomodulatory protein-like [Dermatophagoides farinae]KAH7636588.1 t-cell immunomodulatory protein-like protein [Dermatophagoides farinae]